MTDTNGTALSRPTTVLPALTINEAVVRFNEVAEFARTILREGVDFGTIPGVGPKPVLLKAGAEKLTTFFGLTTHFVLVDRVEDWTGKDHGGEPFFYYLYRCQLKRGDTVVAETDASCNSWESKYRYRNADRTCPQCGQATILKSKEEWGGGWYCYTKKGGCNAKFPKGDPTIEGQQVGRVPNPDIADQVNTFQKMAQKRALVGATLLAVNASEFFTQDLDDLYAMPPEPPAMPAADGTTVEGEVIPNLASMSRQELVDYLRQLRMERAGRVRRMGTKEVEAMKEAELIREIEATLKL
jgi:predicted RNA-binding Zn-ribbon protein involved in translation (DUF1610 family)